MRCPSEDVSHRNRANARIVAGALALIFLALIWRLADQQLGPLAAEAQAAGVRLHRRGPWRDGKSLLEQCRRGLILDRIGTPLAVSWYEHVLVASPRELCRQHGSEEQVARLQLLVRILENSGAQLVPQLASMQSLQSALFPDLEELGGDVRRLPTYVPVTRPFPPQVERRLWKALQASGSAGFSLEVRSRRSYPGGEPFGQIVGLVGAPRVGDHVHGLLGVEASMDAYLCGQAGSLRSQRDAAGRELTFGDPWRVRPQEGCEIQLTIDSEVQRIAYETLAWNEQRHDTLATSAVVLRVMDGAILALCSYPSFDPASITRRDEQNLDLPAVQHVYTPGSTIKPLFLSWALHSGVIREEERFDCGGMAGTRFLGRRTIKEFGRNPEPLTVSSIIKRSSNIGAVRIGLERLGLDGLQDALDAYGLGTRPTLQFPHATAGEHTKRGEETPGYTEPAFSQGYEMVYSPLAMARLYLTLARRGSRLEPFLVRALFSAEGEWRLDPAPQQVISSTAVDVILKAMRRTVDEPGGTATIARSKRWTIAAKTGTAQVDNVSNDTLYNAWFCGLSPATDPQIVVLVHTQLRRHAHHPYTGGKVSGPAGLRIIERTLEYLNVEPDRP